MKKLIRIVSLVLSLVMAFMLIRLSATRQMFRRPGLTGLRSLLGRYQ